MRHQQAFQTDIFCKFDLENDLSGFIAVREMSGRNKISQGQGIVREYYKVSGKFWYLAKLMKNVMEFHIMSGKNDHFRQHDSPVSMYIDQLAKSKLKKYLSNKYFFK